MLGHTLPDLSTILKIEISIYQQQSYKISLLKILKVYVKLVEYLNDKIIHFLETLFLLILDSYSTSQVILILH